MDEVRVVNHGLDTLVVNVYHTDRAGNKTKQELSSVLRGQLEAWKRSAQEVGEAVTTAYVFQGLTLLMQPNGALHGQFPWMLKTRDITLYVSTGSWNGIGAVRLSSEFLWSSQGVLDAIIHVQVIVDVFFQDAMFLRTCGVRMAGQKRMGMCGGWNCAISGRCSMSCARRWRVKSGFTELKTCMCFSTSCRCCGPMGSARWRGRRRACPAGYAVWCQALTRSAPAGRLIPPGRSSRGCLQLLMSVLLSLGRWCASGIGTRTLSAC